MNTFRSQQSSFPMRPLAALLLFPLAFAAHGEEEPTGGRPQTVQDVLQEPSVLTQKGKFQLETSLSYTQNSSNKVSVVGYTVLPTLIVGRIEVSDSDRTTITAGITGRYGITSHLEFEVRVPYVYRSDQISTRPISSGASGNTVNLNLDGGGLGDVEMALRYQFNVESAPYWVGGLRVKSDTGKSPYDIDFDTTTNNFTEVPTGSGLWSIEPSISMIYPSDPAVLFANLAYIYNIKDDVTFEDTTAELDLGDTISLGAGFGFAVNPQLSFSLGINHKTILKSKVDGNESDTSKLLQLDSLNFGVNVALSPSTSVNISAQAGLTEDTPDFQLSVRVPVSF